MTQSGDPGTRGSSFPGTSHDIFRLLVEQVTEYAIFVLDPEGYIQTWNPGAERIKGYRPEEIIGKHFSSFYRPEDRWKCDVELEAARRDGRVEDEGHRVRKDGSLFWANVVITCLRDEHGAVVGFAKLTRDLSERKRAEEHLRQSEERFRLLVDSVKDYAIFMLDRTGCVATWNIGAERIYGYDSGSITGRHFSRFYSTQEVESGKCEFELTSADRDGRFEDEGWRIRSDGTHFWANVVITALRDARGQLFGFAKVTRDLTERRAAEEARLQAGILARARIAALSQLSESLAPALTASEVAETVAEKGSRLADADTFALYTLDAESRSLQLLSQRGCSPTVLDQIRVIGPDSGNPTYGIGTGAAPAVWIETFAQYLSYFPALAGMRVQGPRPQSFACVPLVAEGRTFGVIGVGFFAERVFSDDEREFIATFARQCAQSLLRAQRLESERAAAALAERLGGWLSTTLRSIGDAVIATDRSGAVTFMNSVAESLTGWRETEARGRPMADVFHIVNEYSRESVASPVDKVLQTGAVVGLANHTVLLARDGRETPIDDSGAPIRGTSGEIEGVVLVFRDVTERKRREERRALLAEASSLLAESLELEPTVERVARLAVPQLADWCTVDMVVEGERLPKRMAVAHVNPAKVELARQLSEKYPPSLAAQSGPIQVIRSAQPELISDIPEGALVARFGDGEHLQSVRELMLRSAMIVPLIARGRVLGAISFVAAESGRVFGPEDLELAQDLAGRCAIALDNARLYTSEQLARRNADVANRAKDEFLAIVSHELRTPLNAVMGWSKLLNSPDFDERRRKQALDAIERNSVAMAQLIEDLLDMSRVISGKLRLDVGPVDLVKVVQAAIDSIRPAAAAREVELVPQLEAAAVNMTGDPTRLQQIVWNLLSNAVKFTPKAGRVQVLLRRTATAVEIEVRDTGRGIAPGFLPHVFEAFRQEDASASRSRGGLGLGLAITRQLVELHGGAISAHSAGEGQGASFVVSLPIAAVVSSGAEARRAVRDFRADGTFERPTHLRGLRVLVVDDEEDARGLVATVLEDCGCQVVAAASVREALEQLAQHRPDLLLSDIGMPEQDGYDLIRLVRALPRDSGGDIPAAALTAYARPEDRRRMLNAGFSIHLAKPVEPAELVAVVATLSRFIHR